MEGVKEAAISVGGAKIAQAEKSAVWRNLGNGVERKHSEHVSETMSVSSVRPSVCCLLIARR